jgi:hypothetical protein
MEQFPIEINSEDGNSWESYVVIRIPRDTFKSIINGFANMSLMQFGVSGGSAAARFVISLLRWENSERATEAKDRVSNDGS